MRKIYETALILIGTIGWWGFVYPDMCLTEDMYEQGYEQDYEKEQEKTGISDLKDSKQTSLDIEMSFSDAAEDESLEQSGWKIGDIRIKSRIVEYLYQER